MPPDDWSTATADAIGRRIGRYRQARGLSVQKLSDLIHEQFGITIQRPVLSNLENGRRHTISATEVLILARVLDVPPILLLLPVGAEEDIEVLPGHRVNTWMAAKWFDGEMPLPPNEANTMSAAEWNDWAADWNKWAEFSQPMFMYRAHEVHVDRQLATLRRSHELRRKADAVDDDDLKQALLSQSRDLDAQLIERADALQDTRREMVKAGVLLPDLPDEIAAFHEDVD